MPIALDGGPGAPWVRRCTFQISWTWLQMAISACLSTRSKSCQSGMPLQGRTERNGTKSYITEIDRA